MPSAPTGNHLSPSLVPSGVISSNKTLAYALLRIALGVNFAGHGLIRIYNGGRND